MTEADRPSNHTVYEVYMLAESEKGKKMGRKKNGSPISQTVWYKGQNRYTNSCCRNNDTNAFLPEVRWWITKGHIAEMQIFCRWRTK